VTDPLTYVLACLRRSADNAYPWSVTPGEAGALVSEVEKLRAENADLRMQRDEHLIDNGNAYDEGYDAGTRRGYEAERAAVVAYLRTLDDRWGLGASVCGAAADDIERGEHRREGEP
jgi:hypothetical protein